MILPVVDRRYDCGTRHWRKRAPDPVALERHEWLAKVVGEPTNHAGTIARSPGWPQSAARFPKQPANHRKKLREGGISGCVLERGRTNGLIHHCCPRLQKAKSFRRSRDPSNRSNEKMPATGEMCAGEDVSTTPISRPKWQIHDPRRAASGRKDRPGAALADDYLTADRPACNAEHDHLHRILTCVGCCPRTTGVQRLPVPDQSPPWSSPLR